MSMMKLALINFRNGFRNYLSLVLSLAFTVLVLFNFQNLITSGAFEVLGTRNREYVEIIVNMITFVLVCFLFFFIWYSTNVFLTRRKKEIGIYVFMGLSNEKIGKLYFLETMFTGLSALVTGLVFGALSSGLFQMILLAISDLAVEIHFSPALKPAAVTTVIYGTVYLIFAVKGYINLARSSVIGMISAAKYNEYVRQKNIVLLLRSVLGIAVLGSGSYLAMKRGGMEIMGNALAAVVLVTAGVYLLFGGLIPAFFQAMAENKRFLYKGSRVLWVNSLIFRMKKNYRTYAMVCVLLLCSVTALATSFAMKGRYDSIIQFENTYTFQLLSPRDDLGQQAEAVIGEGNDIAAKSRIPILCLDSSLVESRYYDNQYAILSWSGLKELAQEAGMEFPFAPLEDDQIIKVSHLYLMSLLTDRSGVTIAIGGKTYHQTDDTSIPYLGYLQEAKSFYVVNDREYERLRPMGEELYTYNYRIRDTGNFIQTRDALDGFVAGLEGDDTARIAIDPQSNELDWVKVMYSICVFMFLVFVLASGSIMFMKLYNDAFEEKERYRALMKMGFDREILRSSVKAELAVAYGLPFVLMAVSSLFSVGALARMMFMDLTGVNVVSVAVVLGILAAWYVLSVRAYEKNALLFR